MEAWETDEYAGEFSYMTVASFGKRYTHHGGVHWVHGRHHWFRRHHVQRLRNEGKFQMPDPRQHKQGLDWPKHVEGLKGAKENQSVLDRRICHIRHRLAWFYMMPSATNSSMKERFGLHGELPSAVGKEQSPRRNNAVLRSMISNYTKSSAVDDGWPL